MTRGISWPVVSFRSGSSGVRSAFNPCRTVNGVPCIWKAIESGAGVHTTLQVVAEAGDAGIPRETLELTVMEGLRQLGVDAIVEVDGEEV
jgi:hypothetical protein